MTHTEKNEYIERLELRIKGMENEARELKNKVCTYREALDNTVELKIINHTLRSLRAAGLDIAAEEKRLSATRANQLELLQEIERYERFD